MKILTGKTFGSLRVIKRSGSELRSSGGHARWKCLCICGNTIIIRGSSLRNRHTESCGCLHTHGDCDERFYKVWANMKHRCGSHINYLTIKICDNWKLYLNFKEDMYKSYLAHIKIYGEKDTTIERMDNFGDYTKENCKWATWSEQNRNRSKLVRSFDNSMMGIFR